MKWILENKRWTLIIILLSCCLFQSCQVNKLAGQVKNLKQQHADYITQQQLAAEKPKFKLLNENEGGQSKSLKRSKTIMSKLNKFSLMLILLVPVLTACQSNSALQSNVCQRLPEKPSLSTAIPEVTYSKAASQNIEAWHKKLMSTRLMQSD